MTHFITHVALSGPAPLSAAALLAACRQLAEGGPFEVAPGPASMRNGPNDVCLVINDVAVMIMPSDQPLPQDAWAEAAHFSIT